MTQPSFLLGMPQLGIDQIEITQEQITLIAHVEASEACCPLCGYESSRVHSRYRRTLQDLPCVGKTLRLIVQVRRFLCRNTDCVRKIFVERVPDLTTSYARRTTRFTYMLSALGLALGGKAGAHLGAKLGMPTSRMTILRVLRHMASPPEVTPRIPRRWMSGRTGVGSRTEPSWSTWSEACRSICWPIRAQRILLPGYEAIQVYKSLAAIAQESMLVGHGRGPQRRSKWRIDTIS